MSENTEPVEVAPDPLTTAREWITMLERLVPPQSVEVEDITGAKHNLRANLPAAVETRIMRRMQGVVLPDLGSVVDDVRSGAESKDISSTMGGVVDGVARLIGDETILALVSECFAIAHPAAMRKALANVEADENAKVYLPKGDADASDLFSVTDLIAGVVPFAMRAMSRIGSTAASLLPQAT